MYSSVVSSTSTFPYNHHRHPPPEPFSSSQTLNPSNLKYLVALHGGSFHSSPDLVIVQERNHGSRKCFSCVAIYSSKLEEVQSALLLWTWLFQNGSSPSPWHLGPPPVWIHLLCGPHAHLGHMPASRRRQALCSLIRFPFLLLETLHSFLMKPASVSPSGKVFLL